MLNIAQPGLADVLVATPTTALPAEAPAALRLAEFCAAANLKVRFTHGYQFQEGQPGTLRGLHYHVPPSVHASLFTVEAGQAYVVVADIRKTSSTFGQWYGVELSARNQSMMWVPVGMAYGYLVQAPNTTIHLHTTGEVADKHVRRIAWNDSELCIDWPLPPGQTPLLSLADQKAGRFSWWHAPKDSTFGVSVFGDAS